MDFRDFRESCDRTWGEQHGTPDSLINAGLGVAGEGGEVADLVKKEIYHKKEIDTQDYIHEVGDVLYYLDRLAKEKGFTLAQAMEANVAKLRARYPDGFPK